METECLNDSKNIENEFITKQLINMLFHINISDPSEK
jgi:hypothetical protein